jgi:hypothetical protein
LAALLLQITEHEPVSPSTSQSQVPRDLEVICMKCLRKDPTLRYLTAADFADDLRRWMRGEPILARRITPLRRLEKWARRRPALAALSAALVILTLGFGIWLAVANRELSAALQTAREEREKAGEEREKAERRADFFEGSLAESLDGIGRFDILEEALRNALDTEKGDGEQTRRRRASLNTRLGYVLRCQGEMEKSLLVLRAAMSDAKSLPPSGTATLSIAKAGAELALTRAETDPDGLEVQNLKALRKTMEDQRRSVGDPALTEAGAIIVEALGNIALEYGESPEMLLEYVSEATALRRKLSLTADDSARLRFQSLPLSPSQARNLFALARALAQESDCLALVAFQEQQRKRTDSFSEAGERMILAAAADAEALVLASELCAQTRPAAAWRRLRAARIISGTPLAPVPEVGYSPSQRSALVTKLEESAGVLGALSAADPLDWRTRQFAVASHYHFFLVYERLGDAANCRASLLKHLELARELSADQPHIRQCSLGRITAALNLAQYCAAPLMEPQPSGDDDIPHREFLKTDRALVDGWLTEAFESAKAMLLERARCIPDQEGFFQSCGKIVECRLALGDSAGAMAVVHDGAALLDSLSVDGNSRTEAQWNAARVRLLMTRAALCSSDPAEALVCLEEAVGSLLPRLWAGNPAASVWRAAQGGMKAAAWCRLAGGRLSEAMDGVEQSVDLGNDPTLQAESPEDWISFVAELVAQAMRHDTEVPRARQLAARALREWGSGLPDPVTRPADLGRAFQTLTEASDFVR